MRATPSAPSAPAAAVVIAQLPAHAAAAFDGHEQVVLARDADTGLVAIIAIHSTVRGPAAGGVRRWAYASLDDALGDALRLSRGMSLKNAMAGLAAGGGKAVVMADAPKTDALLAAFGDAVEALGGRYVTAEDVGMTDADMVAVGRMTRHVAGLPVVAGAVGGNPAPFTARGVLAGIRAAVGHRLGRDDLAGLDVAVQGVGHVGSALARALAGAGARLVLADADAARAERLAGELGARHVEVADIARQPVHLFSPNALGGVLDAGTIAALDCAIVAGAANNQLATPADGAALAARGILYAPDYVINAGGIISVVAEYQGGATLAAVNAQVDAIGPRLAALFGQAAATGQLPHDMADAAALRLIGRA